VRVLVALSGGVGLLRAAAALLAGEGHEVVGVSAAGPRLLRPGPEALLLRPGRPGGRPGRGRAAWAIPFYVANVEEAFGRAVVSRSWTTTSPGGPRTRCVACNSER